jgi:methyl coenzyme M reductase subunit C
MEIGTRHGKKPLCNISFAINLGAIMPDSLLAAKRFGNRLAHHNFSVAKAKLAQFRRLRRRAHQHEYLC